MGNQKSKTQTLKYAVQEGLVLAPTLFNIYLSDMSTTEALKLGYADDRQLLTNHIVSKS